MVVPLYIPINNTRQFQFTKPREHFGVANFRSEGHRDTSNCVTKGQTIQFFKWAEEFSR